jgi:acyl-CoA thioesterase FadM
MTSAFVSRWPVLQEHRVTAADLDADGVVRDERVAQWVAAARSAYLRRCVALRRVQEGSGLELQDRVAPLPPGAALGRPAAVVVTAGVREVWPSSFAIAVRLRPVDGDRDGAVDVSCIVRLVDPTTGEPRELGTEVRDELIALEHAAEHYN